MQQLAGSLGKWSVKHKNKAKMSEGKRAEKEISSNF